jgi:glucose-6-phosphate-specific signal transduction histidine kinase
MNGNVKKVFLLVGLLVVIFIAWQLVFNDGGVLKTAYNAVAHGINVQWAKVAGENQLLIPTWGSNAKDNGQAFDINTK